MPMVQRRTEKDLQEEKIKKLEERVRELESALPKQREEPKDELNDLYRRRGELVSRLVVEKDDAKNKELWEILPAIERQKYARLVFEQRKRDVEDIDARRDALKSEKDGLRERRR